ncbi:MATE family efflux transporter [Oscillospiraceae bacterium LTW-04]|nr:MATE family efflux transporter [Oscillospiraceae bacterium MB24-C1]
MSGKDAFTSKIFRSLWIPAILSSVGWALSDIADAVVVGQRMGTTGLAAIALILPVYMINCMFAHGFGIGGSVRYSKLLGAGKPLEAVQGFNRIMQAALALSVLTAVLGNIYIVHLLRLLGTVPADGALFVATKSYLRILLTATPLFYLSNLLNYYLRNDDNGKLAGIGSVAGNLSDIGLNILFVLVLDMGTAGAALSTAIGQIIAILLYLPGVFGRANILQVKWQKPSVEYALGVFKEGLSGSATYLFQLIFLLMCNRVLIRAGNETAVAVFDLLQNTSYLLLYLYEGTNRAMQPLVSTYHGEHREAGKRTARNLAFLYGGTVGVLSALLIFLFPELVCRLFGIPGGEAAAMGASALRLYAVGAVFAGISLLSAGYLQSCNREKESLLIATLRGGAVLLPVTLLFSWLGLAWFWWLFPVTEILSLMIWLPVLLRHGAKQAQPGIWYGAVRGGNENISVLTAEVEAFCETKNADMKQIYYITLTIEEICLAILQNGFEEPENCCIELTLVAEQDGVFVLHIRDNAASFNPFALNTQKASEDGAFDMDAMGMMVIKKRAREFFYRRYGGFNSLVVKI